MYCVLSLIAEEKRLSSCSSVVEEVPGVARVVGAELLVVVLSGTPGRGMKLFVWEMSFARRMQTKRPFDERDPASFRLASVFDEHREVVRVARDDLDELVVAPTSAESLIPRAYVLPKPNSEPCAMKPERPLDGP